MCDESNASPAEGIAWDLSALFASPEDPLIVKSWETAHKKAAAFEAKYRGRVSTGELTPVELAEAIAEMEQLTVDASKPLIFAHLLFAADTSKPENGSFMQSQMEKASEVRVKLMFFDLELQDAMQSWVDHCLADPAMANYVHHVKMVRVFTPHKLSETEEVLLEEVSNVGSRAWQRLHDELTSNQVFKYTNPKTGEVEGICLETAIDYMKRPDRAVRKAAADAMSDGLKEQERTLVTIYNTLLADKKLEDKLRKYDYPEQSRHLSNELDKETVDVVEGMCKSRSDLVARYYKTKRDIIGLPELTHYDRYCPLFDAEQRVSWEAAKAMVLDAFEAFSPQFRTLAEEFYDKGWIDAEVRPGKSGGAFCSSITPDTHPVILVNYLGKLDDVTTVAHELGHGVHASLSREQTYFNFSGTLPMAELASIFAEMLVFEQVVAKASLKDKIALYAHKIEMIFASTYRQAAMYRFEQRCHTLRRTQGEITPEQFGDIWQDEIQSMFQDSVVIGEQHKSWWSYVSHFIAVPFYVYAYAFGELLTLSIFQMAKGQGSEFSEKYTQVLRKGGSISPHELMEIIGVDLRSKEFWVRGFEVIESMITEFEKLWKEHKATL